MLTIKIIIWICKSEMGEPCEPPWLCFYGNNSPGIFSPHSVFLSDCSSHSHTQNPHFPNTHFGRAMFSSFFLFTHWAGYHRDDGVSGRSLCPTPDLEKLGWRQKHSTVSTGPFSAFAFLVQLAGLKISPNYVLEVLPLLSLSEDHTMETSICSNFHPEATTLPSPSTALWQLHPSHKSNHLREGWQLLNSMCSQAPVPFSPGTR